MFIWVAIVSAFFSAQACAGVAGAIAREVIEASVERAAKQSGRVVNNPVARRAAVDALEQLTAKHGGDVLKVVEDSGLELLEAVPKHGDELLSIAAKLSPQGRRALAMNVTEMLPLAKRVGVEAIELEAKVPGQAAQVFRVFGDDAGKTVATSIATEDIPRIVKYGEKADSVATRKLLLDAYRKEGRSLFDRIPPKLVLAGGLSASMLYGTHEMTASERAKAETLRNNPEIVRDLMNRSQAIWAGIAFIVILILLWRFGLMPWQRR